MSSGLIIGLEMTLVLGGVLGFGVWELWRLRCDRGVAPPRPPPPSPLAAERRRPDTASRLEVESQPPDEPRI